MSKLFELLALRGVTLRNRLALSLKVDGNWTAISKIYHTHVAS